MKKFIQALSLVTASALLSAGFATAAAANPTEASATSATPCYTTGIDANAYSVGVGDALYQIVYTPPATNGCASIASINRITGEQWANDFPGKVTPWKGATTTFKNFPGSPDIYAVTSWDSTGRAVTAQKLTFREWVKAGSPKSTTSQRISGTDVIKYNSSDELFVKSSNATVKLTYPDWKRLGFPSYSLSYVQMNFFKFANKSEVYVGDAEYNNPITFSEWTEMGQPSPRVVNALADVK